MKIKLFAMIAMIIAIFGVNWACECHSVNGVAMFLIVTLVAMTMAVKATNDVFI